MNKDRFGIVPNPEMLLLQIRVADIYQGNEKKITLVWITKGEMP